MISAINKPRQTKSFDNNNKRLPSSLLRLAASSLIALTLLFIANVSAQEKKLTFEIQQVEGVQSKPRYTLALTQWLTERQCDVSTTTSKREASDSALGNPKATFLFTLLSKKPNVSPVPIPGYNIIAKGLTVDNNPLTLHWLSHKKQKLSSLRSLDGERLALLGAGSPIGHDLALTLLKDAGVEIDPNKLYFNTSYQGNVGLLLHRNVRAAAVVGPLAKRWQEPNDLQSLIEAPAEFVAVILAKKTTPPQTLSHCTLAINLLKRENRRDSRMKLFPEWIEGFISSN